MSTLAPGAVRAVPVQPSYVRQRAAALIRDGKGYRVLLLRAQPTWPDAPVLDVDGCRVRVALGISQLAVLDAMSTLPEDEYLVVLTDRTDEDLGDAVRVAAWHQGVERIDEWATVPSLFPGARETSAELRRRGDWVATALLDLVPPGGWPRSPSLVVDSGLALGALLGHLLRQDAGVTLDGSAVLRALGDSDVRSRWLTADERLRTHLTGWAEEALGRDVAFALHVASSGTSVAPLAVALAADVLWPDVATPVPPSEQQVAARTRLEAFVGRRPVDPLVAQAAARTAAADLDRMMLTEAPDLAVVRGQAEALLADLGWAAGAATSSVLPAGLVARVRALADALAAGDGDVVEARLRAVTGHRAARSTDADVHAARMAVRLWRWLATPEPAPASGLGAALRQQVDDGAWVDRAVTALWKGSGDPQVSAVFDVLVGRALERRRHRDETAAEHLVGATAAGQDAEGVVAVEDVLADVVVPLAGSGRGVLLVVLDGMSAAVATEVAQAALDLGMVELVPSATQRRRPALAALPTLTSASRTSLLTGRLGTGAMAEEKSGFARATRGVLFHKDDLRPEGGARLAEGVRRAVADEQTRVVGVVLNTIDDALHKTDTSTTRWTLDTLTPLRELLDAAALAGRTVVLTSDHGHVLERGSTGRSLPGAQARWRAASTGAAQAGEVLVRGPRVLAPGAEAVLLWREDVRYGGVQTGYHGGVSLAEMTVPLLVLRRRETSRDRVDLPGWQAAPPQSPPWWNDPVAPPPPEPLAAQPPARGRRKAAPAPDPRGPAGEDSLFDVPSVPPPPVEAPTPQDVVADVLASEVYAQQKRRAGRRAVADGVVAGVLRALLQRGGRAHVETVAGAAGIPTPSVTTTIAALRRLLNVDGYEVLEVERDRVTVNLSRQLLLEQFEVREGDRG